MVNLRLLNEFVEVSNVIGFFVFKQKTAYEMRISDWSSDVCSSDLRWCPGAGGIGARQGARRQDLRRGRGLRGDLRRRRHGGALRRGSGALHAPRHAGPGQHARRLYQCARSEEHTSELQSLMRISYADFCWKKKNYTKQHNLKSKDT